MEIFAESDESGFDVVDLGELQEHMPSLEDLVIHDHPTLPGLVPGVQLQVVEKEPEKSKTWADDQHHADFVRHYNDRLNKLPAHSGTTTVGCERTMAYLKELLSDLSHAVRTDMKCELDEMEIEALRDRTSEMIDQLQEAHASLSESKSKKKNKKAYVRVDKTVVARIGDGESISYYVKVAQGDQEELLQVKLAEPTDEQVQMFVNGEAQAGLTKEAGTAKVMLVEDPFLHAITRILINSHVSAGRNIEEVYAELKNKYKLDDREELSVQELLLQKGLPIYKDFGRTGEEGGNLFDQKGTEWGQGFFA